MGVIFGGGASDVRRIWRRDVELRPLKANGEASFVRTGLGVAGYD